ncbi:MAG TPA: hypothetical protein VNA17_02820 [Pyrinomonadaceae bacterium]|nr:hypothetical protein [Pyrinomonadaceae bacterium]
MASKKHTERAVDLKIPYEQNEIQLKGIFGFGIGLFLLIVITFALMWALLNVMKDYWVESADPGNPMAMSENEKLPPEPRLQLAPGFGVESPTGRVNMELAAPQAEYIELKKQWDDMLEHGQKDKTTGAVTMMPIKEAKERFLGQNVKAKSGPEAEKLLRESKVYFSEASGGRMASETRR